MHWTESISSQLEERRLLSCERWEGGADPTCHLFKWDRQNTNQSVCHYGVVHRQYRCARDRRIIYQSSYVTVHNLPYKLMFQTADWTVNIPDETYSLSGEQNFII